ncbi:MAG: T9SS type A sorting domain-containing protein [Saprospiraceae bacterium]|nr:T9SS type A sorting domain-containing protein [Saprospiraceae bacterium]
MRAIIFTLFTFLYASSFVQAATWVGGNGNWNIAANWSGNQIPGSNDEVIIDNGSRVLIPAGYSTQIKRLHIGSNGTLNIDAGATLSIQNTTFLSGIYNGGSIRSLGSITINQVNTGSYAVRNAGLFNIASSGSLVIIDLNSLAIFNEAGTISNDGLINIEECSFSHSILSQSQFTNNGTIDLYEVEGGIYIEANSRLDNYGDISMEIIYSNGIKIQGRLNNWNNASIIIQEGNSTGIEFTTNDATMDNRGLLEIENTAEEAIYIYAGLLLNNPAGDILIENIADDGIHIANPGTFTNRGYTYIDVHSAYTGVINNSVFNGSWKGKLYVSDARIGFQNNNLFDYNGFLQVSNSAEDGFVNQGSLENRSYSQIKIEACAGSAFLQNGGNVNIHGFLNIKGNQGIGLSLVQGNFNVTTNGRLSISHNDGIGVFAESNLQNEGEILIYATVNGDGIHLNGGHLENIQKGVIQTEKPIVGVGNYSLQNEAFMIVSAASSSTVNNNFVNEGALSDQFSSITPNSITNNGIILAPLSGNAQAGTPYPDALIVSPAYGAEVFDGSWFRDFKGSASAGNYESVANIFTPNSNGVGDNIIFAEVLVTASLKSRRMPIYIPGGIQAAGAPLSGLPSSSLLGEAQVNLDESPVQIFPNPVSELLHISLSQNQSQAVDYRLLSANGQLLSRGTLRSDVLDVSHLPQGSYFLHLATEQGSWTERFVIQH